MNLYYEISGTGPLLLLIPGGADDARDFADIVPRLSESYRVVAYDPRGNSRSRLDAPVDIPVETHADDARDLLEAVGGGPARVFGNSSGGLIGLALAARHPGLVHTVIAHEPPAVTLLPDGDPRRTLGTEVHQTYLRDGVGAAIQAFAAGAGLGGSPGSAGPSAEAVAPAQTPEAVAPAEATEGMAPVESPEAMARMGEKLGRMRENLELFLGHSVPLIMEYRPELGALRGGSTRVVVALGEQSAGQLAYDTGRALATALGVEPIPVPGGHSGFVTHPTGFTKVLLDVLRDGE